MSLDTDLDGTQRFFVTSIGTRGWSHQGPLICFSDRDHGIDLANNWHVNVEDECMQSWEAFREFIHSKPVRCLRYREWHPTGFLGCLPSSQ
jgi:hypothetical protein